MKWTDMAPTEPGMYWWTPDFEAEEPKVVTVKRFLVLSGRVGTSPGSGVKLFTLFAILPDGETLQVHYLSGWWAGPLVPPKP